MKRFHVHLHVADLNRSVQFYSKLFAAEPARLESDYARWMLDDPPVNFAISTRDSQPGIDHLGIQAGDAEELATLKARAQAADRALLDQGTTSCRCAVSEKHFGHRSAGRGLGALSHPEQHPRVQGGVAARRSCGSALLLAGPGADRCRGQAYGILVLMGDSHAC